MGRQGSPQEPPPAHPGNKARSWRLAEQLLELLGVSALSGVTQESIPAPGTLTPPLAYWAPEPKRVQVEMCAPDIGFQNLLHKKRVEQLINHF